MIAASVHWDKAPLLQGLTNEQRQLLTERAEVVSFAVGDVLQAEGDDSQSLWLILEGSCEVVRRVPLPGGRFTEAVLAVLDEHQVVGETSFFHRHPHSATVRAKTFVQALRISREAWERMQAEGGGGVAAQLAINLVKILSDRVHRMDDWVVELSGRSNPGRAPEWEQFRAKMFGQITRCD